MGFVRLLSCAPSPFTQSLEISHLDTQSAVFRVCYYMVARPSLIFEVIDQWGNGTEKEDHGGADR